MEKHIATRLQLTYGNVALAVLAGILLCCRILSKKSKAPIKWPVVGMLPSFRRDLHDIYERSTAVLVKNGGAFTFKALWISKVITSHPDNLEYALKTRFHNFVKGNSFKDVFGDLFGDNSMFLIDGEPWRRMRATVSSIFLSAGSRTEAVQTTVELVHRRLLPLLENASQKAAPMDLHDILHRFTTDSICMASWVIDPGSLAFDLPHVPFVEAYERAVEISTFRMLKPAFWWRLARYLNVGGERRLRESIKIIDEFIAGAVPGKRKELESHGAESLPIFFRLEKESGRLYRDQEMREFSLSFILAGRDTTSVALAWFFWLVDRHPRVEANIVQEIRRILSHRTDEEECDGNPSAFTLEEIKEMHYLQAALSESLRLYPPVPLQVSEAVEDDTLPDGTKVEKGSNVMYFFYSTARMKSVWGSDCREFRPERWLSGKQKFAQESEFKFPVFNAGPRRCPGKELAYWQMKWVAASVMVRYRVTTVSGHPVVAELSGNEARPLGYRPSALNSVCFDLCAFALYFVQYALLQYGHEISVSARRRKFGFFRGVLGPQSVSRKM